MEGCYYLSICSLVLILAQFSTGFASNLDRSDIQIRRIIRDGSSNFYSDYVKKLHSNEQCTQLNNICFTNQQCCEDLKCNTRGYYGRCQEAGPIPGEGASCKSNEDCKEELCCNAEWVGFRNLLFHYCRPQSSAACGVDSLSPASNEESAWETLKKRSRPTTLV